MQISYSGLDTYLSCPLKYKYSAIDKIKVPKSKEAVFGSLLHSTLKFIHAPGILSPTLEQALDFYSKNWNGDAFEEAEEQAAFSQGVVMIQNYYKKNNPSEFNIVDLESYFRIELEDTDQADQTRTNAEKKEKHIISGIIDRIDKTENGYEIIDYKTTKKMPSQEKVDNDIQLSTYLKAFLSRYPKEINNLENISVSLYYLKHGVKLSSNRTLDQLKKSDQMFLDVISEISQSKFDPKVSPLCDWCGYQNICPMWKHKFKDQRKIDTKEVNEAIHEFIKLKTDINSAKYKIAELQEKVMKYMDQEGVERVFGEDGIIARTLKKTYKLDDKKIREILEPLDHWEDVLKVDGVALNRILAVLPFEARKEIEKAKIVDKETKSLSVKKGKAEVEEV